MANNASNNNMIYNNTGMNSNINLTNNNNMNNNNQSNIIRNNDNANLPFEYFQKNFNLDNLPLDETQYINKKQICNQNLIKNLFSNNFIL